MRPPLPAWFDDLVATYGEDAVRAMMDGAVKLPLPLPALIEEARLLRYTEAEMVAVTARIKAATTFHQEAIRAAAPPALPRPWLVPADTVAQKVLETIPHADVADDRELLRKALLALTPDPGETVLAGAVPQEWADAIGIEPHHPHESIRGRFPEPLENGGHAPADIAYTACQRLVMRGILDRVGGLPIRYRARAPLLRRRR